MFTVLRPESTLSAPPELFTTNRELSKMLSSCECALAEPDDFYHISWPPMVTNSLNQKVSAGSFFTFGRQ